MPFSNGQYLNSTDSVICLKTNVAFQHFKIKIITYREVIFLAIYLKGMMG